MKRLSIIVPSYNVEKTLYNTLNSLCIPEVVQFLDIIIVNDGSNDGTAHIAQDFVDKYPDSIRLISKENGGHGSTINVGIDAAVGKYFKVVDGDDQLEKDGLVALICKLEVTKADLIASNYKKVSLSDNASLLMSFDNVDYNRCYSFEELKSDGYIYFGIHSITIRTSILKENQIRIQEHTYYVDTEYALLPIPYINTVEFMESVVYLYNVGNMQQSISTQNFVNHYDDHYRVVKRLITYVLNIKSDNAHISYMNSVLIKLCFTNYMLSAYYDENIVRGKRRAKEFDMWLKQTDKVLYKSMARSHYIKLLRLIRFAYLPHNNHVKSAVKRVYTSLKPKFKSKQKMTY